MRITLVALIASFILTSCWASTPQSLALLTGIYFYEPKEISGANSTGSTFIARPMVGARFERELPLQFSNRFSLQPQFGILFPRTSAEGAVQLSALLNADLGYRFSDRFMTLFGLGASVNGTISEGRNVNVGGNFVTPNGGALAWLFTLNAGLGFWIDPKFRVDLESFVAQLFNSRARKVRVIVELGYAI